MEWSVVSRRRFLYGAAAAVGAVSLSACTDGGSKPTSQGSSAGSKAVGSKTEPVPAPKTLQQSPQLDSMKLPPVAKRLPDNPYVIPHNWVQPGKYGGRLNMNVFSSQGMAAASSDRQFFYGFSVLRWLNDGLDIGPGLAESWESNDDASEWTFHFRKGLRWSDGKPWTTADIMWWWEEFVLAQKMGQSAPDETRSGTGKLAKLIAVDDTTLVLRFDAPSPLAADRTAMWVNGGIGSNGPIWMMPKHYLEQFHPASGNDVPDDWDAVGGLMEQKADWHRNPDCPTMTGYRCKSFDNNSGVVLERNPYYWCVMPNGDQLPYIDEIQFSLVTDAEAGKLQVQQGKVDFCFGQFNQIALSDVAGLRSSAASAETEILLWDSGNGTGSVFFFNYDYIDDDLRELIRKPEFRQAVSLAFDRDAVRKAVYFNTGEKTTGTMSTKAIEYRVNSTGKRVYRQWRDSYVEHNPAKAQQMLDDLGLEDRDGDGYRELPNGKKLKLSIDYSADESQDHVVKDNQLVADLKRVGLQMVRRPISPQSFDDQWKTGKLMGHSNWEVGDGPNHLVYPQWLVPLESTRWAPLEGQWYQQTGTKAEDQELHQSPWKRHPPRMKPDADGPVHRLWEIYNRSKTEPDEMARHKLVWDMIKIHISDGPFYMGCVANYPRVTVIKKDLRNVPRRENLAQHGYAGPGIHPVPAVYDTECFYWETPAQHS